MQKIMSKRVRCLFIVPDEDWDEELLLDAQMRRCCAFSSDKQWEIVKESRASLYLNDEIQPNIFQQLIDICCTAPLKGYDILLITSRKCMDIPESYFEQVIDWLWKNKIEVWSVEEGKLAPPHVSISKVR